MTEPRDELGVLREHLERYRGVTLQTLEMVPEDKLAWYPAVAQFSFGQQFLHIAQTEDFYSHGFFAGDWDSKRFHKPNRRLTRDLLQSKLQEVRRYTLKHLERVEPRQLDALVQVPNIPVEWPLRSWLWYLIEHEIHHKAQLALYLRQIGLTPPFFAYVLPAGVRPDIV